jgi:hypothetical protein
MRRRAGWMFAALVASAVVAGGCASDVQIHALTAPGAHFDAYRTVAFEPTRKAPPTFVTSPHSSEVREQVQQAAEQILKERGYRLVQDDGDLVIRIEVGRKHEKVPVTTGSMPIGGEAIGLSSASAEPSGPTPGSPATANVAGPAEIETTYGGQLDEEQRDLVEGAFVIDVFDRQTHQIVWHGSVRAEVTPGTVDYERLHRSVASVLASFPARSGV